MENSIQEKKDKNIEKKKGLLILFGIAIMVFGLVGLFYWRTTKDQIYIEKAEVSAPAIALSSSRGGLLKALLVKEGDVIPPNSDVAQVGDEVIKTATAGLVIQTKKNIGENFSADEPVVTIINPAELRIVARAEENKGLSDIAVGQPVIFTVDAFGSEKFSGRVAEISQTSRESGVVFNISDKREVKEFDVKIRFDVKKYPQLKKGMSAKAWIFKQ